MRKEQEEALEELYLTKMLTKRDLSNCDFSGFNFSGCAFAGVDFSGCNLRGVNFSSSQFAFCI